ncbi:hypothetical protein [Streptomyces sp. NPDC020965]|uniref:hypothetical protein n=1 Tax=Streptomyces sp. NPDC020965 TaxID=3365105 RepID=UPI00379FA345
MTRRVTERTTVHTAGRTTVHTAGRTTVRAAARAALLRTIGFAIRAAVRAASRAAAGTATAAVGRASRNTRERAGGREPRPVRALSTVAVLTTVGALLLTGCGRQDTADVPDPADLESRTTDSVREDIERVSADLVRLVKPRGKRTLSIAEMAWCDGYDPRSWIFRFDHPWSVYGVPFEELTRTVERLRTELPGKGWKLAGDGGTAGEPSRIAAESADGKFTLDVELVDNRKNPPDVSMVMFTVRTGCYQHTLH